MIDSPVADKPVDSTPPGWRRALAWLTGAVRPPQPFSNSTSTQHREGLPARIGHYVIARKLGEGGIGIVYAARDERLERTVARKTMSSLASDDTLGIFFVGAIMAAATLFVFDESLAGGLIDGSGELRYAQTMAFTTLVTCQLFNVFNAAVGSRGTFARLARRGDLHTVPSAGIFDDCSECPLWLRCAIVASSVL